MPTIFRNVSWGGLSAGIRLTLGMGNLGLAISLMGSSQYGHVALIVALGATVLAVGNSFFTIAASAILNARPAGAATPEIRSSIAGVWTFATLSALIVIAGGVVFDSALVQAWVYWGTDRPYVDMMAAVVQLITGATACQLLTACNAALVESNTRFDLAARIQLIGPGVVFPALLVMKLGAWGATPFDYALLVFIAAAIELLIAFAVRARSFPGSGFHFSIEGIRRLPGMLRGAGLLQGANLANIFVDPLNKYLLNRFVGAATVTHYDAGMKVAMGLQGLFNGAFRTFLQLASKGADEISGSLLKVVRLAWVPAILLHGAAAASLALIGHFWLTDVIVATLPFFGALLPTSLGIIFITPLYLVLIGRGDLQFIFRMHALLAAVNLVASLLLIPRFGLIGAAAGLAVATSYNVYAAFHRYGTHVGPIDGLFVVLRAMRAKFLIAAGVAVAASISALILSSVSTGYLILELALLVITIILAVREPIMSYAMQRMRPVY